MSPRFSNNGTIHHEVIEHQGPGNSGAIFVAVEMALSNFNNQRCRQFCVSVIFPSLNARRIEPCGVIVSARPAFRLGSGPMIISARMNRPALSFHVMNVVGLRSYKNVSRPNTRCVIALMQGIEPFRNLSIFNGPCDSMSWPISPVYCKNSISTSFPPCPYPAWPEFWKVFRDLPVFINSFPKTSLVGFCNLTDWFRSISHNVDMWIVRAAMLFQQRAARLFTMPLLAFN